MTPRCPRCGRDTSSVSVDCLEKYPHTCEQVAAGIQRERERCASIVERRGPENGNGPASIAAIIRSGIDFDPHSTLPGGAITPSPPPPPKPAKCPGCLLCGPWTRNNEQMAWRIVGTPIERKLVGIVKAILDAVDQKLREAGR